MTKPLRRVVILGGGTSGWMTASALLRFMNRATPGTIEVTVVEGPDGPSGVGEATIPTLRGMLSVLGIDERDFMVRTNATFKQAIKFVNWLHDPAREKITGKERHAETDHEQGRSTQHRGVKRFVSFFQWPLYNHRPFKAGNERKGAENIFALKIFRDDCVDRACSRRGVERSGDDG